MKVFQGRYLRASHIKNGDEYRKLYPSDDTFFNVFEFHKMPSRQSSKKVRFLLAEIESYLGHQSEYGRTTLEHVCPYNPEQNWNEYFGEGTSDIQDRLGNMVLLEKDKLGRSPFETKKEEYLRSGYPLAQKIASYEQWDINALADYQSWLATQAINTWRVNFLLKYAP